MKRIDLNLWASAAIGEVLELPFYHVRASVPVALIAAKGDVVCATGTEIRVAVNSPCYLVGPEDAVISVFVPEDRRRKTEGEIFTNLDNLPEESGSQQHVKAAMREMEIRNRATLRQAQAILEEAKALRAAEKIAEESEEEEVDDAETPEPEGEENVEGEKPEKSGKEKTKEKAE